MTQTYAIDLGCCATARERSLARHGSRTSYAFPRWAQTCAACTLLAAHDLGVWAARFACVQLGVLA